MAFPRWNVQQQSISTDIMPMNSTQALIPSIKIKFECVSLLEPPGDVAVGDRYGGDSTGDGVTIGAVYQMHGHVSVQRTK